MYNRYATKPRYGHVTAFPMRPQFSLASIFVAIAVAGAAALACVKLPVHETAEYTAGGGVDDSTTMSEIVLLLSHPQSLPVVKVTRPPSSEEVMLRMAWSLPTAVALTIGTISVVRRLRERRSK